MNIKPKDLVVTSMLIAIVFVATNIRFPIPFSPTGGLMHVGTVALFVSAVCFGPKKGAVAGSLGMALFNLMTEWAIWAPFTLIIRSVMGFIIGYAAHYGGAQGRKPLQNIAALVLGGIWFIPATYIAEAIITGNIAIPVNSIPGNLIQLIAALAAGPALVALIQRNLLDRSNS